MDEKMKEIDFSTLVTKCSIFPDPRSQTPKTLKDFSSGPQMYSVFICKLIIPESKPLPSALIILLPGGSVSAKK